VRRTALTLPGVEVSRHPERPSYRVGRRVFATHGTSGRRLLLRLSAHEQQVLVRARPAEFERAPRRPPGWTRVDLARVDGWLLEQLIVAAWRRVARTGQAAAWDAARTAALLPRATVARRRR
jgi:hypothetical protein